MQLDKIITLANKNTKIRFLAMERSLRAVGCDLPLLVIPYDEEKFELPVNSTWWELDELSAWLEIHNTHKMMRKYQCLLTNNYQFVDTDVIFLKNPVDVLSPFTGFITSCGHWHNPNHTITQQVLNFFNETTTIWQQKIFNAGQFACDKKLYDFETLKTVAESKAFKATCLDFKFHDQPGLNLLVNASRINVTNLTLQPFCMESSWAGDYDDENFKRFWQIENKMPYLIHWAGCNVRIKKPIDDLFLKYLNPTEIDEWLEMLNKKMLQQKAFTNRVKKQWHRVKKMGKDS